jgi:hypothetical protein
MQKYKNFIEACPCLVCQRPAPSAAHHWHRKGHGAKGMKAPDERQIPLCGSHHREFHDHGRETFANKYDIDIEYVIERLTAVWLSITKPIDISSK